ncbi:bifunctional 5-dehydro-2-deoxygluconokinase/5-dehydro-2-deoxyphosphogluconate aldolase [Pseudoxanthomonas wuyuanensis]|uniref:5-dehydro-2-deoxygluconokinase n=1 Tax=Pseudoxanthomonas wuyuanensis TaxID=1073196 RepID=A0A286D6P0_9GAMM|nr:5-dehydro-2-deoxygluconokinase [Pseudoxanthomonas wuyuanensis]KAF1721447.1 5-dehydro-2-deoxygluconokinase [Pseudoxanthomonas wuyuanensis]SOD54296.1 5-dehydro-2-deoxygluconokinase [Pseudoxanthomonas wuyuanensis]
MAATAYPLDLITIGRSCIDLYGEQIGGRLEDMASFAKYIGGSPTNTAVGGARLGLRTGLLTRVGADHFGRFIREQLNREGVSTIGVKEDPERLTALVFLGIRDPDTFPLIFYRENCADMALEATDVDPAFIRSAAAVLINGTHLSQDNVFDASVGACRIARAAGARVIFDIDYRPVLWGLTGKDAGENRFVAHDGVTARLQQVLPLCDLIVGTEEEVHILGGSTDTIAALRVIRERTTALLVCKRGAQGCSAFPGAIPDSLDEGVVGQGFSVEVFNVLGAGDAFMAGFLRGWLRDEPLETACGYANACGAIVVSRHGCSPAMPTWEELQEFLDGSARPFRLRDDAGLEHLHWASTRDGQWDELTVLAMDHRSQFEALCQQVGADPARIPAFKALALKAVDRLAQGDSRFGVLLDGRFGMRGLEAAADHPYWIGRPIELPGSCPLAFESAADVATELATWPANHVVKCLVFYHPDDAQDLRERQERQLLRLQDAARKTRHELLVEIIASRNGAVTDTTVARAIQRLYDLGMKPDWWKLEPSDSAAAWANIERSITDNDPHCRGVVLLGLSAPEDELIASFQVVAANPIVKGFAVGRTIFADAAEQWLAGRIDDEAAIADLSSRFAVLVQAWRAAKAGTAATSEAL